MNHDKVSRWEYIAPIAIACITIIGLHFAGGFINGAPTALRYRQES